MTIMRGVLLVLFVAGLAVCPRARAQEVSVRSPATTAAQPIACATPTAETLFARVPASERADLALAPTEDEDEDVRLATAPRVVEIELDGVAPREAVLGVDAIVGEDESASLVWVFACRGGTWSSLGLVTLEVDSGWDGTIDTRPGIAVMRAETIGGVGHDMLRLEHLDVRGSHDPRFVRRRFLLVHVIDGRPVTALDVVVREDVEAGPERDTVLSATRTIVLRPGQHGRPPRYRLAVAVHEYAPSRRFSCRTWLVFDGRTFAPASAACAER